MLRKTLGLSFFGSVLLLGVSCSKKVVPNVASSVFKNQVDSVSYAFGLANGDGFRRSLDKFPGDSLNREQLLAGFTASLMERSALMSVDDAHKFLQGYVRSIQEREAARRKQESDSILIANKAKEGVTTTESGLQYRVLREGTGIKSTSERDTVEVHYRGTLLDGTPFDSSYERREPARFALDQVIKGWTEGVALMPVGSKYEFYVPSELAYGNRGAGDVIPPNSALIFEVELLNVSPYQEPKVQVEEPIKPATQSKTKTISKTRRK